MISNDAGATSSSINSPIARSPIPTLSPAPSLTLSPASTTSDKPNHRPFPHGMLRNWPNTPLRRSKRKRARSENLGCITGLTGVFRGIKCVENSLFTAEISAIEFATDKHYPVPAAASLVHFEFQIRHRISSISIGIDASLGIYSLRDSDSGGQREVTEKWKSFLEATCLKLSSREPFWPALMCERANRSSIWAQAI